MFMYSLSTGSILKVSAIIHMPTWCDFFFFFASGGNPDGNGSFQPLLSLTFDLFFPSRVLIKNKCLWGMLEIIEISKLGEG